ncbi:MAG: tetratricopeptide repeat protein [Verrucomicrobiales bacterium]|nr:tetratricopeptide repeat protein [Verrucomicrobiales bacterium]
MKRFGSEANRGVRRGALLALVGLLLLCGSAPARAAAPGENRAWAAANRAFEDQLWERAEAEFARFAERFPESSRVPEALLRRAQAQFHQGRHTDAIAQLSAALPRAGLLTEEYLFWLAHAQAQAGQHAAASDTFERLLREFPNSTRRTETRVALAAARARLGQWPQIIALLGGPDGAPELGLPTNAPARVQAQARLLLGEAFLAQNQFDRAEAALRPWPGPLPSDEVTLTWQRQYLLCRAALGAGRTNDVFPAAATLIELAQTANRPDLRAESVAFLAGVREAAGQADEAAAAWKQNLAPDTPPERQREALVRLTELTLTRGQLAAAIATLEEFLNRFSNAPAADVALLTLGELHLKGHLSATRTPPGAPAESTSAATDATNQVRRALEYFDRLLAAFPDSAQVGHAQLNRGWCFWLLGDFARAADAFEAAAARLPDSPELAVARFKLADARFAQNDPVAAREHYAAALAVATNQPDARPLVPQLLQQLVRVNVALTNAEGAAAAMRQLLEWPEAPAAAAATSGAGPFVRALLLVGQSFLDARAPERARALFAEFVERFPESPERPAVELHLARALEKENRWAEAQALYAAWMERFPEHPLRPQAEFFHALAAYRAGAETNALALFTNFVARFPTHPLAPQAQWWIADHFYNRGEFPEAEKSYRLLFQTWPQSELAFEACMMSGRAALGWRNFNGAIECFTNLASRLDCPPALWAQAVFAYGNTLMLTAGTDTNRAAHFEEAIRVFSKIHERQPTNEIAALAWGEIAKCYWQLQSWSNALSAFERVMSAPVAGPGARSEAQVGLALMLEEMARGEPATNQPALLRAALNHCLDVLYLKNLREGESPDWFWVKKAGLEAGRLAERLGEWSVAVNLYRRLQELMPPLRESLERKIQRAREQAARPDQPPLAAVRPPS